MRLAILGSGSAVPDPERGNPSQAVIVDGTTLLFDCGERTTVNLVRAGINPLEVDTLFFGHGIIEARQMWSHSGPANAGRVAEAAGVRTLVLTHLGPYTSPPPSIAMASMDCGEQRGPDVWEAIVSHAWAALVLEVAP